MTAWHGLEARVRRQWALLSFTRSIPIQGDGTAAFQTNFRLTFLLFLSFPLLFFFPFPFSFSSAQFLQKVNPPSSFLERPFMFQKASLCLFAWKRESMVIIFLYLRFSCLGVAFRTEQGVGNLFRKIGVGLRILRRDEKFFSRKFEFLKRRHADGIVSVRVIKSAKNKQARQEGRL